MSRMTEAVGHAARWMRPSATSAAYFPRGDCAEAEKKRVWSPTCPRCEEVAGAGVCPAPGSFVDFALLFNATYVLCLGDQTCPRHRAGYWPPHLHERIRVFDGRELDKALAHKLSPRAAAILGLGLTKAARRKQEDKAGYWLRIVRHRILALLASLRLVEIAKAAGLPNVLILEGDVRPVPRYALSPTDLASLRSHLQSDQWEIVRPSGYFYDFAQYRLKQAKSRPCPSRCRCTPINQPDGPASSLLRPPACVVRRAKQNNLEARCDVRDTVGFAAHSRTFGAFRKLRRGALEALTTLSLTAAACVEEEIEVNKRGSATHDKRGSASQTAAAAAARPVNASFGWSPADFDAVVPWFDKWLPARFDTTYLLPSIVVQQIRQADVETSIHFRRKCMEHARPEQGGARYARPDPLMGAR